jgi:hypothetical protein
MYSCAPLRNFTSMTASDLELLLQLIGGWRGRREQKKRQDTNTTEAIPIITRLVVTLRF